jgi:hypothetical protein
VSKSSHLKPAPGDEGSASSTELLEVPSSTHVQGGWEPETEGAGFKAPMASRWQSFRWDWAERGWTSPETTSVLILNPAFLIPL